jgi:hypothetical protein
LQKIRAVELLPLFEVEPFDHVHAPFVYVVAGDQRTRCESDEGRYRVVEDVLPVERRHVLSRFMRLKHRHLHTPVAITHETTGETGDESGALIVEAGAFQVALLELSDRLELPEVVLAETLRHLELPLQI